MDTGRMSPDHKPVPADEKLNIAAFTNLFSVMNQSYKLFWFLGILDGVRQGMSNQTFGEIVNRMVANAWRPVLKYNLQLGPADAVQRLVRALRDDTGLSADAEQKDVLLTLSFSSSPEIGKLKNRLIQYVPYRLQTPFMEEDWKLWDDYALTVEKINSIQGAIYTIEQKKSIASIIHIRPEWMEYLTKHLDEVSAWTEAQLMAYLQKQNPGAGDIRKLLSPETAAAVMAEKAEETPDKPVKTTVEQPVVAPVLKTVEKKGRKQLTPRQKLWRRIKREFPRKKFIGDIIISDEEFELLVQELNSQHRRLMAQPEQFEADEVFCVALVQFGIRFYDDGAYWPFIEQRVNPGYFRAPHRAQFGNAFLKFMKDNGKLLNEEKKAMSNILLHGFVSDHKSGELFDFLYSYYSIDLDRDIERLDRNAMSDLAETIKINDGRKRTYNLVEHTSDAVRVNERGSKTRLRRYLKLIDRAFWQPETLSNRSENRLMKRFAEWWEKDEEKIARDRSAGGFGARHRSGWKPYLNYDFENDSFSLVMPARLVRGQEEPVVYWIVRYGNQEKRFDLSVNEAVTGCIAEEAKLSLEPQDIFSAFELQFFCDGERLNRWKIQSDAIRFFETDGDYTEPDMLRPGDTVSFSASDYIPVSEALYNSEKWSGLLRCSYQFDDGDIIVFPDKKVLNIGKKPAEGLLNRGLQSGVFGQKDGHNYPVYASAPSYFARILPKAKNGTQLRVNGKAYKLFDDNVPREGVLVYDLQERTDEEGMHVALSQFGVTENGLYHVELDIPNDYSNRVRDFLLINGLQYSFDDAPYIFVETGVLSVSEETGLVPYDQKIKAENEDGQLRVAFAIPEEDDYYRLSLGEIPVAFEIPKLSYRFQGEETWRTKLQVSIWHKDLPDIVEIRYPSDKLTILLDEEGNEDEDSEQHILNYSRNQEKGCFICDLHPFRSWYGRRVAVRHLYVRLPGMKKPARFMNINTKNVFMSAVLTLDPDEDIIRGEIDVIGKAPCYADLWFGDRKLLDKERVVDGKISLNAEAPSGVYRLDVYESESDDDGFDEPDYDLLASKSMELINPANLTGSHIEIKQLARTDSDTYLRLKQSYTIFDLLPLPDHKKGYYSGHMVVREKEYGKYRDDYPVCVQIPDLNELSKGCIFWLDEYEDHIFFVYDNDRALIRRQEDRSVTGVARYRRFSYLMDDEYFYRIDFVEKPADMESKLETEREERKLQLLGREQNEERRVLQRKLDPLCKPLRETGLPIAIRNELMSAGILYTTDLKNMTMYDLSKINGLNRTDIEQCLVHLRKAGYKISMF